jgi:hypothetical protein
MDGFECTCGARGSIHGDAQANCRCEPPACVGCPDESADGYYNDKPMCVGCATREHLDPGTPLESPLRHTPEGVLIVNEDAMVAR